MAKVAFRQEGNELSVALAWAGALACMLQFYYDFSGYSDMAIGLGRMFGFEFPENFNYPYISRSVVEYWRRWHISLGEWFRDYLHYPLSLGPAIRLRKATTGLLGKEKAKALSVTFPLFAVVAMIGELSVEYGIAFSYDDLTRENFNSLDAIAELVERLKKE